MFLMLSDSISGLEPCRAGCPGSNSPLHEGHITVVLWHGEISLCLPITYR